MNLEKMVRGEFITIALFDPPEGIDTFKFLHEVETFNNFVDAIMIPDSTNEYIHMSPIVPCMLLAQFNVEPIMEIAYGRRSEKAVLSDVLAALTAGVRNIVFVAKNEDEVYAEKSILEVIKEVRKMVDEMDFDDPDYELDVKIGLSVNPLNEERVDFKEAKESGVDFIIALETYDPALIMDIIYRAREAGLYTIMKVGVFTSFNQAKFAHKFIPELCVPDELLDKLYNAEDQLEAGVEYASEHIKLLKELGADGVCLMPIKETKAYEKLHNILSISVKSAS
ncbi:MAG: methylenetetrahydrofolate reductase [Candidatus Jordarchaeaceae archaeon]